MLLAQSELESGLPTVWEEEVLGEAIVLKVFRLTGAKAAAVGGCRVKQGRLVRSGLFRVIRDREVCTGTHAPVHSPHTVYMHRWYMRGQ